MSDVFISYARSTAQQAQAVAIGLRSLGHAVWLDDELPAHRAYADVIEERLKAAKAGNPLDAVTLWRNALTGKQATKGRPPRQLCASPAQAMTPQAMRAPPPPSGFGESE